MSIKVKDEKSNSSGSSFRIYLDKIKYFIQMLLHSEKQVQNMFICVLLSASTCEMLSLFVCERLLLLKALSVVLIRDMFALPIINLASSVFICSLVFTISPLPSAQPLHVTDLLAFSPSSCPLKNDLASYLYIVTFLPSAEVKHNIVMKATYVIMFMYLLMLTE